LNASNKARQKTQKLDEEYNSKYYKQNLYHKKNHEDQKKKNNIHLVESPASEKEKTNEYNEHCREILNLK